MSDSNRRKRNPTGIRRPGPPPKQPTKPRTSVKLRLDQIEAFLEYVARGCNGAKTAKYLCITESTLQKDVKAVQAFFGGNLMSGKGLSERGELAVATLRNTYEELSRTCELLNRDRPVVRIGYTRLLRSSIELALRDREQRHDIPDFDVQLNEMLMEEQARALDLNRLDIGFGYVVPEIANHRNVETAEIADLHYMLLVPCRAISNGRLDLRMLSELRYITTPRTLILDKGVQWLEQNGLRPARTVQVIRGADLISYAASGFGFGFLPSLWRTVEHTGAEFVPLDDFDATMKVAAYSCSSQRVQPWLNSLRDDISRKVAESLRGRDGLGGNRLR